MPNIPQSTEKIIQKFIDRVNKLLGKRVKKIILYGSYARGDYNEKLGYRYNDTYRFNKRRNNRI